LARFWGESHFDWLDCRTARAKILAVHRSRPWRNWQTRKIQVLVPQGVLVRLQSAAIRKAACMGVDPVHAAFSHFFATFFPTTDVVQRTHPLTGG
jgi:hypothetical protein